MHSNIIEELKKFDIFSDFSKQELKELESNVYWRTYKKGQLLFVEDDPRERIYFLLSGFVKLMRVNKEGEMIYFDYIKSHTMFPYGGMLMDTRYHYSAEAVTDVELLYIPTSIFEEQLMNNRNQLIKVVNKLSNLLEMHENRIQKMPSAQQRVIQTISYLMNDLGEQENGDMIIKCPITITEISRLSGTSRETVSQVLKQLKKEHKVSVSQKQIAIHAPAYFRQ
ncbi:MAG: Crp/Fnr family transcriptional regulator [Bacillus sp. (in: firmicutes)]